MKLCVEANLYFVFCLCFILFWKSSSENVLWTRNSVTWTYPQFFKDFVYLFLERGREGETQGEKHQCVVASCVPPTGDQARNPGMYPDWESNRWPFDSQWALTPLSTPARAHPPNFCNGTQKLVLTNNFQCELDTFQVEKWKVFI